MRSFLTRGIGDEVEREIETVSSNRPTWRDVIGPVWGESEIARLLHLDRDEIASLIASGRLIGIAVGGHRERLVPAFQVQNKKLDPVVAEAAKILLEGDAVTPIAAASWFITNQPGLGDKTPLGFLAEERNAIREQTVLRAAAHTRARLGT